MISGLPGILVLLFLSFPLRAGDLVLSSGNEQTLLMELYTSEGCSSCPPMESYINRFTSNEALWTHYIPVAFHVGYWDYLGWVDRYASPAFVQRHRRHASEGSVGSVYTPALIVNGTGWRPRLFSQQPTPDTRTAGKLEVRVNRDALVADFKPIAADAPALDLHIALLAMNLKTEIRAGENNGRTAQHEFVVTGFKSVRGVNGHWQAGLPELHYRDTQPRALAVWVTRADSLKPLQAVGGYLPFASPFGEEERSQGPD